MSLRVDLNGNGSGFSQMLDKAKHEARSFGRDVEHEVSSSWGNIGKSFAAGFAGMFTVEGVKSGIEWFVESGKQIKESAEQVDMSTDSWQKWSKAVDDAGLSTEGFSRVIESLRQKRTDALTDPKARGELTRLGFSDSEITGNMDMDTFLQRSLANANGGDLQRGYLSSIIGTRGLKYASALPKLSGEDGIFTKEDIKEADELAGVFKKLSRVVGEAGLAIFKSFASGEAKIALKDLFMPWKSGEKVRDELAKADAQAEADWNYQPVMAVRDGKPVGPNNNAALDKKNGVTAANKSQTTVDPMDAKLAEQADEFNLHDQEEQQRMLDSQRGLMTIGQRRTDIMKEMTGLQTQLSSRNAKLSSKDKEAFLTNAQKDELAGVTGKARDFAVNALREKFKDQTDEMQLRYNKDKTDLREKPLDYKVTEGSKKGLYDEADAHINWDMVKMHVDTPEVREARKTNEYLKVIAESVKTKSGQSHPYFHSPHTP